MSPLDPVGVFGGTFDPVHFGHLRLAEEARERLGLAAVRWLPAGAPPLRAAPSTPAAHRVAMVRLAIADNPHFALDTAEADSPAISYTVDTLRRLRAELGATRPLVLLLGADAFGRFEAWHEWREIFTLAHVGVASRPGEYAFAPANYSGGGTAVDKPFPPAPYPGRATPSPALAAEMAARHAPPAALRESPAGAIVPFHLTPLDISATVIRARLVAGASPRYLLPEQVLDYIHMHHLY